MNVLDILKAARAKITLPEHWTQNCLARDEYGRPVRILEGRAACWCAVGAITAAAQHESAQKERIAHMVLEKTLSGGVKSIGDYNDSHTHAEVLARFDEAIASLERSK